MFNLILGQVAYMEVEFHWIIKLKFNFIFYYKDQIHEY